LLHTGDIGVMDAGGNVTITDRLKDMFMVGGFNAYPAEIEAMLRTHGDVAQVAVIGVPDERMGEVGCAYIVPGTGVLGAGPEDSDPMAQGVMGWARDHMANYKVPRQVVLVEALPLNAGGKVLKRELRQRHAAGQDHVVTYERSN
jgi:HIP---CoA ligase